MNELAGSLLNGGLNGAFAFDKNLWKQDKGLLYRRIGANFGTGVLGGLVADKANSYAINKMNQYMQQDKNFNLAHFANIAAPSILGTTYAIGATMHAFDDKVFGSKTLLKTKGDTRKKLIAAHWKYALNPLNHMKRGVKEISNSFKLFEKGISGKTRLWRGVNLLSLAASTLPAIIYAKNKLGKKEQLTNINSYANQSLQYTNPYINTSLQKVASNDSVYMDSFLGKTIKPSNKNIFLFGTLLGSALVFRKLNKDNQQRRSNWQFQPI